MLKPIPGEPLAYVSTMVELLRLRAREQPGRCAYTFLSDGTSGELTITYRELDRRARAIAAHLQSRNATGDCALLFYPPGLDFVAALFGCFYAGVVAVPAYPPRVNRSMTRLQSIVSDAGARWALSTSQVLAKVNRQLADTPGLANMKQIATDTIDGDGTLAESWKDPGCSGDTLAYLQYTSGSTSDPKGVMISHANLLSTLADLDRACDHTPDSVMVSWLPTFHDLGLIYGVLVPCYRGFACVLLAPADFLQRPIRWLKAITRYKGTHSAAPNFSFDLCVDKITEAERATLDLRSWRLVLNAAEPVRVKTMDRFSEAFKDCGFERKTFCPGYGLAETTVKVSATRIHSGPVIRHLDAQALERHRLVGVERFSKASSDSAHEVPAKSRNSASFNRKKLLGGSIDAASGNVRHIVGCGCSEIGADIRIVDPDTLASSPSDTVGEIWVSSTSVAQGYWNRLEATEETFHARLSDTGEGPFLRTGDLGFLKDEHLYITGRVKDLIVIRGRNHYPQDIEYTAENSHAALRADCSAAFSVDADGEERLVIALEVKRTAIRKLDADEVAAAICQAVAQEHEVHVSALVFLKTTSIPKTSSGKIQHQACKRGYLDGTLKSVAQWQAVQALKETNDALVSSRPAMTARELEQWLVGWIGKRLGVRSNHVDIRTPFDRYGLDSQDAVGLSGDLEVLLERKLPPTLAYDYPNISVLARKLVSESSAVDSPAHATRSEKTENMLQEPIAIVGMACRFPGAPTVEAFWNLLHGGVDAITEVPPERWNADAYYHQNPATAEKMNTRWGGFVENVDRFDPAFFGITPREAELIDPQHRLLLEVAWEALENAGLDSRRLAGSAAGVFVGISGYDYARMVLASLKRANTYSATGNALSIAANRLSYWLDLRGPSLSIDTACSSSLVALHQACRSLRFGECELALSGGVNLLLSPEFTVAFSQAQLMASDGRCKTFDAAADGYVRSEGCGVIVLKRLSDAVQNGDNILAVVRGSAVNQDGRSNGITAPNGPAQEAVMRAALADASVSPRQIGYVEAHGTGTALGDPIEMHSIRNVLAPERTTEELCQVGSVKTNIGHLESAAGIAGIVKVVLALQHEKIPPHLHLNKQNPHIDLQDAPIRISKEARPWPVGNKPRLAGVSSFGFGGTNAHVILEEAPARQTTESGCERKRHILTLSAKSEAALRELAGRYREYGQSHTDVSLGDVCHTANAGRTHFEHRAAIVAESMKELDERLAVLERRGESSDVARGTALGSTPPKVAFLFTGQGSQYAGMGREIYETEPEFRAALDECADILQPLLDRPLIDVLYGEGETASLLNETAYAQPALFALEYALAKRWMAWGVQPAAVMGHSVGELTAACVAGVFGLEDGLKLIAERGRLMQALPRDGQMVAVFAGRERIETYIAPAGDRVSFAAFNGPSNTVISGARESIEAIVKALDADGIKTHPLNTSHAFHSPLIEPILLDFEKAAAGVTYAAASIPLVSNLIGARAADEITTPGYWRDHIRQPVQFEMGVQTLHGMGFELFLEIGPNPTLSNMGRSCLPNGAGEWLHSLRAGRSDWQTLLSNLSALYVSGVEIDWARFDRSGSHCRVALPTYPFQRKRYWFDSTQAESGTQKEIGSPRETTPTVQLLEQGRVEELAAHLTDSEDLTEASKASLADSLRLITESHQREKRAAHARDWTYEIEWQPKPIDPANSNPDAGERGLWLIFADAGGVGCALSKLLRQRSEETRLVYPGDSLKESQDGVWQINPRNAQDFERLLECAVTQDLPPLTGIVHLWSLDTDPESPLCLADFDHARVYGCEAVMHCVQAAADRLKASSPRFWLATRQTVSVENSDTSDGLAAAPLWGLGRTLALEHPSWWGGLIDLDLVDAESAANRLLSELLDSNGEDHVALRDEERYTARLRKKDEPVWRTLPIHADGTYWITGGLGALGLLTASWLVDRGARSLALSGRSGSSAHTREAIQALEESGANVYVAQADVANESEMAQVRDRVRETMPPLRGVLHAAGCVDDVLLLQMNAQRLNRVMSPKVRGAWNLHTLTEADPLDFFVLFSSVASVLGSPGQANYAAANAFLDALAHYRRGRGLPAVSINWGPWKDRGIAMRLDRRYRERLEGQGIRSIAPDDGMQALESLLGYGSPQVTVAPIDWKQYERHTPSVRPSSLLSDWVDWEHPRAEDAVRESPILKRLNECAPNERTERMTAYIQQRVLGVTGLDSSRLPNPQHGFVDMGMDSLMLVELKNQLEAGLGHSLPATLAFEYATIDALSRHLVEAVLFPATAEKRTPTHQQQPADEEDTYREIRELGDAELEAIIEDELGKLS